MAQGDEVPMFKYWSLRATSEAHPLAMILHSVTAQSTSGLLFTKKSVSGVATVVVGTDSKL